jgi:uncharacterized protein (TIGR02453 family)
MNSEAKMSDSLNLEPVLHFLSALRLNNNKPWFDSHRREYEAARGIFEEFFDGIIDEFRGTDNLNGLIARDCIARIYRDIRFSKDKSPYKTNMAGLVGPGGWRGQPSGYYISIEPGGQSLVAGGLYNPTAEQLDGFRREIARDASEFKMVTSTPEFTKTFGTVEGERLKTAPKGYDRDHPEIALLQLKQITAIRRFTDQQVLMADFSENVFATCRAMRPFLDYLDQIFVSGN